MSRRQDGFSIIELLVTIAIIGVIAGIGFGTYKIAQGRNQLTLTSQAVISQLRRAQVQSQAVNGDSQWGVKIQNNTITVFKGATYAARVVSFDEVYNLPNGFTYSGINEIIYSKLYGYPTPTGTITVTAPNGSSSIITINASGAITY